MRFFFGEKNLAPLRSLPFFTVPIAERGQRKPTPASQGKNQDLFFHRQKRATEKEGVTLW